MVRERILVVEDEAIVRDSILRILGHAGFRVDGADSGALALDRLRAQEFDLLLIDIKMPGMTGIQFLRQARGLGSTAGALIITGYGTMDNATEAMELGAQGFLIKPVYPQQLLQVVQDTLTRLRLIEEVQRLRTYAPLLDVSRAALGPGETARVAEAFLEALMAHTHAHWSAVLTVQRNGGMTALASLPRARATPSLSPAEAHSVQATLAQAAGSTALGPLALTWPRLELLHDTPASAVAIPLVAKGMLLGLLAVQGGEDRVFGQADTEFLWITASFMAVALENARSFGEAQARIQELEEQVRDMQQGASGG